MPNRTNKYFNALTDKQFSTIITDWVEAMKQLQQWYKLLTTAIEEHSNQHPPNEKGKTPLADFIKLRSEIDRGLIHLTKEIGPGSEAVNIPLEILTLIKHTEIVLHWCIKTKRKLGVNVRTEYLN